MHGPIITLKTTEQTPQFLCWHGLNVLHDIRKDLIAIFQQIKCICAIENWRVLRRRGHDMLGATKRGHRGQ